MTICTSLYIIIINILLGSGVQYMHFSIVSTEIVILHYIMILT